MTVYKESLTLDQWALLIRNWSCRKGFETGWKTFERKLLQMIREALEAHDLFRELEYNITTKEVQAKIREEIADLIIRGFDFLGATQTADNETTGALFVRIMEANEKRPYKHGKRF